MRWLMVIALVLSAGSIGAAGVATARSSAGFDVVGDAEASALVGGAPCTLKLERITCREAGGDVNCPIVFCYRPVPGNSVRAVTQPFEQCSSCGRLYLQSGVQYCFAP